MEKEKRFSEELLIAVLLVGLAFGVVAGMAIYASAYPIFHSAEWAAWVQAVGSVGAILVAVYVMKTQAKQQALMQQNEWDRLEGSRKDEIRATVLMLISAVEMIETLASSFRDSRVRNPKLPYAGTDFHPLFGAWSEAIRKVDFTKGNLTEIASSIMSIYVQTDRLAVLSSQWDAGSKDLDLEKEVYFALDFLSRARNDFIAFGQRNHLLDPGFESVVSPDLLGRGAS